MTSEQFPFSESLLALVTIAAEETGANGFALYEFDQGKGLFSLRFSQGLAPRQPQAVPARLAEANGQLLTIPLRGPNGLGGLLDLAFPTHLVLTDTQREALDRTISAIERLIRRIHSGSRISELVNRIEELEIRLADLKISDRARGLARQRRPNRAEILGSHVASVIDSSSLEYPLRTRVRDLEQKLEERHLVALAKAAIQAEFNLSEEDAYFQLRETSRRTRTRLVDVARNAIARQVDQQQRRLSA